MNFQPGITTGYSGLWGEKGSKRGKVVGGASGSNFSPEGVASVPLLLLKAEAATPAQGRSSQTGTARTFNATSCSNTQNSWLNYK